MHNIDQCFLLQIQSAVDSRRMHFFWIQTTQIGRELCDEKVDADDVNQLKNHANNPDMMKLLKYCVWYPKVAVSPVSPI